MSSQRGFSLIELLVAMGIMLLISGAATTALLNMTKAQATIWNRTQMHSGIRGATEVLQQEVGQSGRISLPGAVTLSAAVSAGNHTVNVSSAEGMFVGEKLTIGTAAATDTRETVTLTAVNATATPNTITATFANPHTSGSPVRVFGAFAAGIVPPSATNGSTGSVLKLFGDINSDGQMVYVEYTCDTTSAFALYRSVMDWDATSKPTPDASNILLMNIRPNPDGSACFTYQTSTVSGTDYVTDVAITLTVQTQQMDQVTKQYQTETKALLNVAPRNVFDAWEMASLGQADRIQPTPPSITTYLLP